MKRIKLNEYNASLGTLIDIEDQYTYSKKHHKDSINIPYQKLIYNYKTLLDKSIALSISGGLLLVAYLVLKYGFKGVEDNE